MLERNLLAPPGVLVWLSTPKRLCSLLYTGKQRQPKHSCDYTSTATYKDNAVIVWPSYLWSLLLTTNSKLEADAESIIAVCSLPLKLTLRDLAA